MNNASLPLQEILRRIPSVDELLQTAPLQALGGRFPRKLVVEGIRQILEAKRQRLLAHPDHAGEVNLQTAHLVELILDRMETLDQHTLRPVVNATGIVIHTNLGRSLLPRSAIERLEVLSRSYNNLEYDLERGRRGSRYVHAEAILCEITGAEAALVVNNNAGAVFLVLNTLAKDREVIVSRGQLVEIGGSFRIPDVMASSGAILREVGCTNRTHLRDYQQAVSERTALLMKVHSSNYRILGFTAEVSLEELVILGRQLALPVVEDLGSGSFYDLSRFGLQREPTAQEAVANGADVVTFSGDKLLGGPQAGIVLGRKELVGRCKKNPLTRALRVDKLTLAALEATLRLYRDETQALEQIPTLRMISTPPAVLEERAQRLAAHLHTLDRAGRFTIALQPSASQVGGGSLPAQDLPTWTVALHSPYLSTQQLERRMRAATPPVIGRIEADKLLLDVRTLQEGDIELIADVFATVAHWDSDPAAP
jgi:L-seryl-tRNA(Ser) seleniumtransferase